MEHHAYYIEGPIALFEKYKALLRPFYAREYERFGIDEARTLIELGSLRNTGDNTIFFIATASITSEAQQALLKLFEEPQRGSVFILLVPHGSLIATLRSRMLPYPEKPEAIESETNIKEFLKSPHKERSEEIMALLKDEEGVRERVRAFLEALERELHKHLHQSAEVRRGLSDIAKVRSYLGDRSPSLKMLLEHLAVALPTLK